MKKKFILVLSMIALAACLFAISVSAAEVGGIDYTFDGTEAYVNTGNQDCELTEVVIPEAVEYEGNVYTVTKIQSSAFRNNKTVVSVVTPSTLKSIGEHAFRDMKALKTIVINAGPDFTAFSDAEVYGCDNLESADLSGCVGLLDLGGGGQYDHTFTNCYKLSSVKLPRGLVNIGKSAFSACSSLTEIDIPSTVTIIEYQAFKDAGLVNVRIPDGVTKIEDYAFQSCKNLESIWLPEGLTYFGCNNLQYTKVKKVIFPSTLVTMPKDMFNGVYSVETVVFANSDVSGYVNSVLSACGPLNNVFYAGSDASVLVKQFSSLSNHSIVSYEQYLQDVKDPNFKGYTKTIIYGTKNCKGCGEVYDAEDGFVFESLLSKMFMGNVCDNCGQKVVGESFDPIFVSLGYSSSKINGKCGVVQGFMVDYDSLEIYNANMDADILVFGVIVVADSQKDNVVFDENGKNVGQGIAAQIKTGHNYFEIKAAFNEGDTTGSGIPLAEALIHACAYVKVGDDIVYISNGAVTGQLTDVISFNEKYN